jgi:hypothetical protein
MDITLSVSATVTPAGAVNFLAIFSQKPRETTVCPRIVSRSR